MGLIRLNNKLISLGGKPLKITDNIVTDGLVLYLDAANPNSYPGTGTIWYDLSPNKLNASITSGANFISNGNKSYFTFTAQSSIYIPNNILLSPAVNTGQATYECWIRGGTYATGRGGLFNKMNEYTVIVSNPSYAPGVNLYSFSDSPWSWQGFNATHTVSERTFRTNPDDYSNLVFIRNGTTLTIYANGEIIISEIYGTAAANTTSPLEIGDGSNVAHFDGQFFNFKMYIYAFK